MATPAVLVTGFTGFLGKVVVEELCRQQLAGDLPTHQVLVVIRSRKGKTAEERFDQLCNSICFSELKEGWRDLVQVVDGDLEQPSLALTPNTYDLLCSTVTHIIHCAASVDFDRPIQEATRSNVDTSLHILELARQCSRLRHFVDTSTAYVSTRTRDAIPEALVPLPGDLTAEGLYSAIRNGSIKESDLLRTTGHPNTYTLTKCIAEHLLYERRGAVPLSIVRPSIISVALQRPFPGYIDSYGALGGFGALFGAGFLHVMEGDRATYFDVVPVDLVSQQLIDASELSKYASSHDPLPSSEKEKTFTSSPFSINHSTAGLARSGSFDQLNGIGLQYFTAHQEVRPVFWKYTGPRNLKYHYHRFTSQSVPVTLGCFWFKMTRNKAQLDRAQLMQRGVRKLNAIFPYFLSNTFDFTTSLRFPEGFEVEEYLWLCCRGIHRHLIRRELWQTDSNA